MAMRYIDLHTHSMASDGAMAPAELVSYAAKQQVGTIAITDHDTVAGVDEAIAIGKQKGVLVIPGVEVTAMHDRELHILGLHIDTKHPALAAAMEEACAFRTKRNLKMLEVLGAQGFKLTPEAVLAYKPGYGMDTIGRVHVARAMVERAYCGDMTTALREYVAPASHVYKRTNMITPEESIRLIHEAGGYAFLAHGGRSYVDEQDKLVQTLDLLRSYGLDGVECYHSAHSVQMTEFLLHYCEQHQLLISGGSDFHGEYKPHVHLATMSYGLKLPEALIHKLNKDIEKRIEKR